MEFNILFPLLLVMGIGFAVFHVGTVRTLAALTLDQKVFAADAYKDLNSQNITLLQAAQNSDPTPILDTADITIVDDTALITQGAPLGLPAEAQVGVKAPSGEISLYVVRAGDSISEIANSFGVSINTILWANDLKKGSVLRTGQSLVILPISGVRYTVSRGDTIASIAKKFKGDADEIMQFNNITDETGINSGDNIVIPHGEVAAQVVAPKPKAKAVAVVNHTLHAVATLTSAVVDTVSGYFMRPISGGIKTQGIHGYNGVDLASSMGTPIMAAAAGSVIVSKGDGWNGGYGSYVVISHDNGTQTLYAHMSAVNVNVGDHVVQGQTIGAMGQTGKSTGVHLHFEVRGGVNPF